MTLETLPLVTAANTEGQVHLFVGTGARDGSCSLTIGRLKKLLATGVWPVVVNPSCSSHVRNIRKEWPCGTVTILDRAFQLSDLTTLGRAVTAGVVDTVFVNLPLDQITQCKEIFSQCTKLRIPINTLQRPEFSTFNLIPTYRDPRNSGLQISVTTNGRGYILADRIKREIVRNLPSNISQIVTNMGLLRDQIIAEHNEQLLNDKYLNTDLAIPSLGFGLDEDTWESHKFNKLINEFNQSMRDQQTRRARWLSQIMEYYPFDKLADITMNDLEVCKNNNTNSINNNSPTPQKRGTLSLVGSGPGSVSMLTLGALNEIKTADIILADKLVPQAVLDLIPATTETYIAKKFPGNAERAQNELLSLTLESLQAGKKTVRLKQGDPYIFGRGGEEYLYFTQLGYEPTVLPGISSALAATVVSKIPATQRAVADQVLVCTGTGRKGALPEVPDYVSTRTTVFLMTLHRADLLTKVLLDRKWDPNVPVAIVERASCPDQRVTRTLLQYLPQVIEQIGSRPPGLLVVGHSVNKLITDQLSCSFTHEKNYHIEEGFKDISIDWAALAA